MLFQFPCVIFISSGTDAMAAKVATWWTSQPSPKFRFGNRSTALYSHWM